jgi:aspartokinase-like uncharacterized kinase
MRPDVVVKVGGSLYDLPDLRTRLSRWLDGLASSRLLLVPGGGDAANLVRALDRQHGIGEETSHWMALRALSLNAHFIAGLLARGIVAEDLAECPAAWQAGRVPVLEVHAFARADEGRPGCLPHTWAVTSDSLAARVAVVAGAPRLVLLKSVTIPAGMGWEEAGWLGHVDPALAGVVRAASVLEVRAVNLRAGPP